MDEIEIINMAEDDEEPDVFVDTCTNLGTQDLISEKGERFVISFHYEFIINLLN